MRRGRSQTPEEKRLAGMACKRAQARLRDLHREEYERLVDEERVALGLPPVDRRPSLSDQEVIDRLVMAGFTVTPPA